MSEERLPEDWVLKKIGDVCSIMGGGTPSRQVSDYFGGSIVWLTPTEINKKNIHVISTSREYITTEGYKNSSARIIPTGSVLLTSRASIGYVAIAGCDLTTNQGFAAFTPLAELHNLYLAYWLKSQKKNLEDKATGTTFKEIAKAVLKTLELPLPPLPVQQQIVAKIEELFSELDAGVQELKTALFRLKVYRQAVLQNKLSNKNWPTIQLDGLLQPGRNSIKTGPFGMALGKTDHRASGIPVLGIENIGRGKFWDRNKIFITADKAAELSSYTVSEGDLIISRSGTVGEICMVPSKMQGSLISTNLIKLSLNKNIIDSQYFCYLFLGCQSVLNAVKEQCNIVYPIVCTTARLNEMVS